jgi:hypothetical protein
VLEPQFKGQKLHFHAASTTQLRRECKFLVILPLPPPLLFSPLQLI